jgi:hypothetical protein
MANIKNEILKEEPASYEAFVYRWTNLDKNKIYIGYHTGFIGDGYKHSGQCKDFNEDFQNQNYQWQYEVLDYGTTDEMKNLERDLLKAAEARKSDEYYNQTNAGSAYFHVNTITTEQIVDNINLQKYLQKDTNGELLKIKKDLFEELLQTRIQVRSEDNKEAVKHISDEIDDVGGTENCDSITLLENRLGNGKHQLLDGSTTMMGTLASKHGMYLTYNLIPEDTHKKLDDISLREIGLLLNPIQKKKKWDSKDEDFIDHIMYKYQHKNEPIKSKENLKMLKKAGCNGSRISTIFDKCKQLVELNSYIAKGTPWIRYALPQNKSKIETRVKEIENTIVNTKVFAFSSEKYRWEDVTMYLIDNNKLKNKLKNISVIVHFPKPKSEKKWNKELLKVEGYMEDLCKQFEVNFLGFEYMQKY